MSHPDSLWNQWRARMTEVEREVQDLAFFDTVFRLSMRAMRDWPSERHNFLYAWQVSMNSRDVGVCVRRILDRSGRTRSFLRLLEEIARQPGVVSRERFVEAYPPGLRTAGEEEFERLLGSGGDKLTRAHVRRDIEELESAYATSGLQAVTNEVIVHNGDASTTTPPTWRQVHDLVALIERACRRYIYLLLPVDRRSLLPGNMEDVAEEVAIFWLGRKEGESSTWLRELESEGETS